MGGVRRVLFVTAAVAGAVAVAIAAGVDATDLFERVGGWLVRIASETSDGFGFIGERAPRGSARAALGISSLLDALLVLALGPAGPAHRRVAGACAVSAKVALETAHRTRGGGVGGVVSSGSVVAFAATRAFADSLGTPGTVLFLSVLFALAEGWRTSRIRARRAAANAATRDLALEGIRRLANMSLGAAARAPEWAGDAVAAAAEAALGDVEKVRWWNDIMATAWPNVSTTAQMYVRNILEPMLDHDRPPGISEMKFDDFNLGDVPPEIASVAVVPPDEPDEIQIQLRVQWRGTPDVVFKVSGPKIYGGMSPVKIAMTDLTIAGTVKVTLAHLMGELPVVGGLQVTLTEDPTVTYKVAVKAAPGMPKLSLNSIPGLKAAISGAVVHALRDTVVFPKSVNVHLAKHHTPRTVRAVEDALRISPVGRLTVTVVRARGLRNADFIGTSDPYVGVALGSRKVPPRMAGLRDPSKKEEDKNKNKNKNANTRRPAKGAARTRTVRNDLNPAFDETFALDVMSTELQCVWIRVFDDDGGYSAHDLMGAAVLPMAGLPPREDVRGEYALKSAAELDGAAATKSRGSVELVLRYEPVEEQEEQREKGSESSSSSASSSSASSRKGQSRSRATSFQRSVARWLGVRDAASRSDAATIASLLRDETLGSLRGFSDETLRILAKHTPTRMDVGGGVPLWAAYSDFSRVAFANHILLTVWPYASAAIKKELSLLNEGGVLREHVRHVFAGAARKAGTSRLTSRLPMSADLLTVRAGLDLGAIPPTIEGVRVRRGVADEIVMEWSVKIAGDGFAGLEVGVKAFPMLRLEVTAGEAQLLAVIRVRLRPLVPRAPIVAGASVSFFGETVCDGRIDAKVPFLPRIDVLSLPPFRFLKAYLLGPALRKAMMFPAAVHVPVLDFEHPAVKHLASEHSAAARAERHALGITVLSARNLDAADVFGTSDPFCVVALAGEGRYDGRAKKTTVKKRTLNPKWHESFTYVVADPSAARDVLFAVFDSDGKGATARAVAPEKVRAKIAPVKALHLRALEVSERYLYRATRIPWAKAKPKRKATRAEEKKSVSAATKPKIRSLHHSRLGNGLGDVSDSDDCDKRSSLGVAREKKPVSLGERLAEARRADVARRAAEEPPPPFREETEEEREAFLKASRRAARAKRRSSSKSLTMDTKKNLAAFNPNRVVSDVEACVVRESVMGRNDLLGAATVDFASACRPGESRRFWLKLEGCPGDAKRAAMLETPTATRGSGCPELEIELAWRTYDPVGRAVERAPERAHLSTRTRTRTRKQKHVVGALRVDVSHANDLCKPRSILFGKMSGAKLTPRVVLRVGGQSAGTSTGRSANPGFREGFDFFGVTALDELVVEVVHSCGGTPKKAHLKRQNRDRNRDKINTINTDDAGTHEEVTNDSSAWARNRGGRTFLGSSVGDKSMGVATVPLHGVVRSGTITGTYALSGVKHGDVTMTLTFRAERQGRDGMNERDA